jgi:Phosphotransferase enzyme family
MNHSHTDTFTMHTNNVTRADHDLVTELHQFFPLSEPPVLLPSGEGRTYRAGDFIYRREARPVEATYIAELFAHLPAHGFRLPRPIRSFQGAWLAPSGWSAWTYIPGQSATAADVHTVIPAIEALHQALAVLAYPAFLGTKDTPYTRAEHAAWDSIPPDIDSDIATLVRPLMYRRHVLSNLPQQLIHIDLNDTNILIAPGMLPAFIDFTPSWRPAGYATAVFAYWLGVIRGHLDVLDQCATVPAFDQLLLRVSISKAILMHELRRSGMGFTNTAEWVGKPIERVITWFDQRNIL